jgi:hypothetical protein
MDEVILLRFDCIGLQVFKVALQLYRTRFCKLKLTGPQLLAFLRLMRHDDWTSPKAGMRAFPPHIEGSTRRMKVRRVNTIGD